MTILSLFDGMSCGQIALKELGYPITRYYASEIDKHAIAQTQLNFPGTIQLGDVEGWREWDIPWGEIDLILAGSPCQGFSLAGRQLGLDDPRSRLFWVFVEILEFAREHNPRVRYLLENVRMKPEHERIINETLGLLPVVINSALVSAQNRVRLYWTNIRTRVDGLFGESSTDIPQPEDRGITIGDILEDEVSEKYVLSDNGMSYIIDTSDKTRVLLQRGRGKNRGGVHCHKSPTLTSCNWESNHLVAGTWRTYKEDKGFRPLSGDKCGAVVARAREDGSGQGDVKIGDRLRRLTPTECARLQTIPSWYRWQCSDTQAYKMLGNGWTIEVIKHILSFYEHEF